MAERRSADSGRTSDLGSRILGRRQRSAPTAKSTSSRASSDSRRSSSTPTRTSGSGELDLPEQQMHTSSYWLTIPSAVMAALPYGGDDRRDGVDRAGLRDAARRAAAADVRSRTTSACRSTAGRSSGRRGPAAGAASRKRWRPSRTSSSTTTIPAASASAGRCSTCTTLLLERTRELIAGCPCESGCPSCVGPEGNTGPHAKLVASEILDRLWLSGRRADGRSSRDQPASTCRSDAHLDVAWLRIHSSTDRSAERPPAS